MSFYLYISDKMNLEQQGILYKKKKKSYEKQEGFTTAFPNAVTRKNEEDEQALNEITDDYQRNLSNFARNNQIAMQETKDFLTVASRDNKYKGQNITTSTGVSGYVTQQGIFKPFNSKSDMNATIGKNNCPSGSMSINVDSSTYNQQGTNVNSDMPFPVGTPMTPGQRCGNEGTNIFVSSVSGGGTSKKYVGCKKFSPALQLTPYGKKADVPSVPCPAGTFQCPNAQTGYCYNPSIKSMVSTYMVPEYDAPAGTSVTGKGSPFLSIDGVTNLWVRQQNFDTTCGNMPTVPPCPKGTAPCQSGIPGYCYDPNSDSMVTTFTNTNFQLNAMPTFMFLITGQAFLNLGKAALSNSSTNINDLPLQSYYYDNQVTTPNLPNRIYEQFRSVAEQICPYLNNNKSTNLTVISNGTVNCVPPYRPASSASNNNTCIAGWTQDCGEDCARNICAQEGGIWIPLNYSNNPYTCYKGNLVNSSNSKIIITRTGDNTANIKITPSDMDINKNSKIINIDYQFSNTFGNAQFPLIAQDGVTKLYIKSKGFDRTCGQTVPNVPPTKLTSPDLASCEAAARMNGSPIFAYGDGQCYLGNNINSANAGITNDNCVDLGSGNIGIGDSVSVYQIDGASNSGLGKYGFITADAKLKEYPEYMIKPSDKFKVLGNYKVPVGNNSYLTKILSGSPDVESCQKSCISELGDSCNGMAYNPSTRTCEIYGQGTYPNGSPIEKSDDYTMYLRQRQINNDISCPKEINWVDSNVWNGYPKDGFMDENTLCNLAAVTKNANQNVLQSQTELNNISNIVQNNMNNLHELEERLHVANKKSENDFNKGVNVYNNLYNVSQQLQGKRVNEGFTNYDELKALYNEVSKLTSINEHTQVGMKDDSERYLESQTAKFAAWGILAVSLVMGAIKISNK